MREDVQELLSLQAVRQRSRIVLDEARRGRLNSFDYHESRMTDAATYVIDVIDKDFGPDRYADIPPHGRWQHLEVGGKPRLADLHTAWKNEGLDQLECTRRFVDLFFVSVLLDAGAGHDWRFTEPGTSDTYSRSEGIGVASLYMFLSGAFSGGEIKTSVDAKGLANLTENAFIEHFQISDDNVMVGVSSRVSLMQDLAQALLNQSQLTGPTGRPGNIVDYLVQNSPEAGVLDFALLWTTLQKILIPAWPKNRTAIDGDPIGDAWPLRVLERVAKEKGSLNIDTASIQPFHKLTQWLAYSLAIPFTRVLGFKIINDDLGTGLPEYRNGGLFYDLGVLTLKPDVTEQGASVPSFGATSDAIVEWRAMTVALLDELYAMISKHYEAKGYHLSMAQMLEAGSWKSGRLLAAERRPETKAGPFIIEGDGTLF